MTSRFSLLIILLASAVAHSASAQVFNLRAESNVPREVDVMYDRGLKYLASSQGSNGSWADGYGSEPGVVGLCMMAFLGSGEDPNFGPYAGNIERGIDYIISQQDTDNGFIGRSMYNHGFATLALAELYGVVENPRVAPALESAVKLIVESQKDNAMGAWRYTPDAKDADSTVAGCQIVALYAARNAGIPVPESAFKKGLKFLSECRRPNGGYGYVRGSEERVTLTAIGSLCHSLAKERDSESYKATLTYLKDNLEYRETHYPYYFEYYMSQALFHSDLELWETWNANNIRYLGSSQGPDGSWPYRQSKAYSTACSLLSLALNYRFLPIYER